MEKCRADVLLLEKGYFSSREKAKTAIISKNVKINGAFVKKPGELVSKNTIDILITYDTEPYVSRAGDKLKFAVDFFEIELKDKIAMDIGASTGGFCDVMLRSGAKKIYAIDSGQNQLHEKIASNPAVINFEKCNFREFNLTEIYKSIDFITIDVSFISVSLLTEKIFSYIKSSGFGVCLIKPQFEAGKSYLNKNGIVTLKSGHVLAINKVLDSFLKANMFVYGLTYSPIKGSKGNIEFLLYFGAKPSDILDVNNIVSNVVLEAHKNL